MTVSQRSFSVDPVLDLRPTLRAVSAKSAGVRGGGESGRWWIGRSPDGPVTLRFERTADRTITTSAWGRGAPWGLEHAPAIIGADDDVEDFRPPPGLVAELHRRNPGLRLGRTGLVFASLLPIILQQRVTTVEAGRSYRSICRMYGEPAPGPVDAFVAPGAETVGRLTYADLHPHGVERSRATIVIEAARRHRRLEAIVDMTPDAAAKRLMAIRGIGPWTAAWVMGAALGDPDSVPVGDYHLPNTVSWALAGEPRADDDRMIELLEPYRGHRRRVIMLLKQSGISAPKYGPKTAPRSIANH